MDGVQRYPRFGLLSVGTARSSERSETSRSASQRMIPILIPTFSINPNTKVVPYFGITYAQHHHQTVGDGDTSRVCTCAPWHSIVFAWAAARDARGARAPPARDRPHPQHLHFGARRPREDDAQRQPRVFERAHLGEARGQGACSFVPLPLWYHVSLNALTCRDTHSIPIDSIPGQHGRGAAPWYHDEVECDFARVPERPDSARERDTSSYCQCPTATTALNQPRRLAWPRGLFIRRLDRSAAL